MKSYKNHLANQALRRQHPSIRRIINGKPVSDKTIQEDANRLAELRKNRQTRNARLDKKRV
jgi:hypothetical protein